jgi:hypothetical protein
MEQDRDSERTRVVWPWLLLLVAAGLVALAVVVWQSEAARLIWANLWELLRSRRGGG